MLASMSLELAHGPIDSNIIALLEKCGRRYGLSLEQMELLGQSVDTALGFVDAFDAGDADGYLDTIYWSDLEAKVQPMVA